MGYIGFKDGHIVNSTALDHFLPGELYVSSGLYVLGEQELHGLEQEIESDFIRSLCMTSTLTFSNFWLFLMISRLISVLYMRISTSFLELFDCSTYHPMNAVIASKAIRRRDRPFLRGDLGVSAGLLLAKVSIIFDTRSMTQVML